ncbi:GH3 auxin-responsive promoter family protein [Actinacidiphila sp. ITFR-21]|uniref:GH3 auxin-responsive promoter family protein n=1 Tax=Actinacidiphila sp. ITFR-21 TaxID=3075199 RepID=UPI00288A35CC|nr:GH3 auxin-responsive promoter family protein [Streptomyces sp. ITFR-21]WNI17240.1 GH3 auxin-responsive promoter family protein [Streptomyces sp. ITFR-21]
MEAATESTNNLYDSSRPLRRTTPFACSCHAFTDRVQGALELQRRIYATPAETVRQVFEDILGQSADTEFGRAHSLGRVRTLAEWRRAVPIQQYEDIEPYVRRAQLGHDAVLTTSRPYAYLKTSGSSGAPKHIPTTRHWRDHYRGSALYAQWGLYFEALAVADPAAGGTGHIPQVLDLSWERAPGTVAPGALQPVYSISNRPAAVSSRDWLPPWYDEPWFVADPGESWEAAMYRKLRLLAGSDVRAVVALNPSKVISLAQTLVRRGEQLVADLHDGTLDGRPAAGLTADREGAARLRRVFDATGGAPTLVDLWPRLSLAVAWNSASASLYRDWLAEVLPGVPRLPFSTTGTEGIVTLPVDGHPSAGPLAVNQGVYEFVPVDDRDLLAPDTPTLDFADLEEGREYRLVMSQANGLLRYDVGDVYRVAGRYGAVPRLEFTGRAGFRSSFTGEKLTETHVHQAVVDALPAGFGSRPLFSCVPVWGTPPGYHVVIEGAAALGAAGLERFREGVDAALRRINVEYGEKRRSQRLGRIEVTAVPVGAFAAAEERLRARGASANQVKHHWLQRDGELLDVFRDRGLIAASTDGRDAAGGAEARGSGAGGTDGRDGSGGSGGRAAWTAEGAGAR